MENVQLRFALAAQLNRMRYGDSRIISRDDAQKAWPPTGDHDRSFEAAFHAMALAAGGHRPETSYTTQERIERDLDETFRVEQRAEDGGWVIHRRLRDCPHCRGNGVVRFQKRREIPPYVTLDGDVAEIAGETVETRPCDHRHADNTARNSSRG